MIEDELSTKRSQYQQALQNALAKTIQQLSELPEIEKIIIFGSYAEGRRDLFTDLDLLIVMDSKKDILQRTADLYLKLQADVDMDLLIYTPQEFKAANESGFLRQVLKTGRILYEREPSE